MHTQEVVVRRSTRSPRHVSSPGAVEATTIAPTLTVESSLVANESDVQPGGSAKSPKAAKAPKVAKSPKAAKSTKSPKAAKSPKATQSPKVAGGVSSTPKSPKSPGLRTSLSTAAAGGDDGVSDGDAGGDDDAGELARSATFYDRTHRQPHHLPSIAADGIKVVNWNVNGLRAMLNKGGLLPYVAAEQPGKHHAFAR